MILFGVAFWLVVLVETMFWRDRERDNKDQNGGPPCGQVRVLVVGDSGNFFFSKFLLSLSFWLLCIFFKKISSGFSFLVLFVINAYRMNY